MRNKNKDAGVWTEFWQKCGLWKDFYRAMHLEQSTVLLHLCCLSDGM